MPGNRMNFARFDLSCRRNETLAVTSMMLRLNVEIRGRFWLMVSYGDPWAHRALLAHSIAGLGSKVGIVASDG